MPNSDLPDRLDSAQARLKAQVPYLTVEEAATIARCNARTIRRAFESGALRAIRPAHRVLIREDDLRSWIEAVPARETERRPRARRRPSARSAESGKPVPGSLADLREIERATRHE